MSCPRTTRSGGSVVRHATLFPLASALPESEPEESATRLPTPLTSSSPSHSLSFDRRRREILQRSAVDAILRGGLHRHPADQDLLRRANHPCRQQGNTLHRGGSRPHQGRRGGLRARGQNGVRWRYPVHGRPPDRLGRPGSELDRRLRPDDEPGSRHRGARPRPDHRQAGHPGTQGLSAVCPSGVSQAFRCRDGIWGSGPGHRSGRIRRLDRPRTHRAQCLCLLPRIR